MEPKLRLHGLACLIIGGTSGIGLATARLFLQEGARVLIAGHPDHAGVIERDDLASLGLVQELALDVSRADEVAASFREAYDRLGGRLDVLLYAAGISGRSLGDGPLHTCTPEAWRRVTAVNIEGAYLANREALRRMLDQPRDAFGQRGAIVNVGSVVDRSPSPRHFDTAAYAASKGALRALTLACAARYSADGVRFNLVEPGLVDTPMATRAVSDKALAHFNLTKQPLSGGPLLAADVAEAGMYLASPAARHVTGASITVDGGWCLSDGQENGA